MAVSGCKVLIFILSFSPNARAHRHTQTHKYTHTHKHPEQQSGAEDGLSTILVFKGTSFLNCFIRIYQWFYMPSDSDPRLFVIG